jgi:hypothetical protein
MKVLICDDEPERSEEIAGRVSDAGQQSPVQLLDPQLTDELKELFAKVKDCIDAPEKFTALPELSFSNGVDIVILDNNLAHLDVTGARLTAESIAGYIRAFTTAPYTVSLNKNPDVDFDLRYLVGDYSTRADIALNREHLANPALWDGNPANAADAFLPWYWPQLESAAARRLAQYNIVLEHLDDPVFTTLGFDAEAISLLSPHALGALSSKAEAEGGHEDGVAPEAITFRQVFIARDRSLPVQDDRRKLSDAARENAGIVREIIARIVSADIDLWFRRDVVGPQEPLVDVPHLLMRLPFLLGGRANELIEWNKCVSMDQPPYGLEQNLFDDHLRQWTFANDIWVPHACFWWHKVKADKDLNELFFDAPNEGDWADVVFCEDRSAFAERAPEKGGSPVEFPAEFEGAWGRRYVAHLDGKQYAPRSRLAK